jgi:hypothetical protein
MMRSVMRTNDEIDHFLFLNVSSDKILSFCNRIWILGYLVI